MAVLAAKKKKATAEAKLEAIEQSNNEEEHFPNKSGTIDQVNYQDYVLKPGYRTSDMTSPRQP